MGPLRLLILQATPFCNLACTYCYLPDKSLKKKMSYDVIAKTVEKIQECGLIGKELSVVWHAGEPLAAGIEFYRQAHSIIKSQLDENVKIKHCIQSNGTLISDAWCELFTEIDVHLGLSIDGPEHINDRYRKTKRGGGSLQSVLKGVEVLQKNNIPFHTISVVTKDSLKCPDEIFWFLYGLKPQSIAFNVEEVEGTHQESTISNIKEDEYRSFLRRMHELSFEINDPNFIREFRQAHTSIMSTLQRDIQIISMENNPLSIINVDIQGNFSTFSPELLGMEHPMYGNFILGNMKTDHLKEITSVEKFQKITNAIKDGVKKCQESCDYFFFCGGGAPSNKLFENGSFNSTETLHCRYSKKMVIDTALERVQSIIDRDLGDKLLTDDQESIALSQA